MEAGAIQPTTQAPLIEPPIVSESTSLLPTIFKNDPTPPELIAQGAEALLYRTTYLLPEIRCALKYRPSKPYRHPILDARLTKHRILSEARVLVKCRKEGVPVPAVYALDEKEGWLMVEWVEGEVSRIKLNHEEGQAHLKGLMGRIGSAVGRMHAIGIIHGDLTTSNMMLRPIILIDFGLASQSTSDEDRAVDLYVLERAFSSTHPRAEPLFSEVLDAYGKSFKGANIVLKKLEDVRMRGRKRSMLG
ncbi:kinase-like protein [Tricladium varicosporioides]|nr:kinase-like protein [Hymenoscyphus varicosporioides]